MKIIICLLIIATNCTQATLAQELSEMVLSRYFQQVGLQKLMGINSYVHFYQTSNGFNENMFQEETNQAQMISFYKKHGNDEFYRTEGTYVGNSSLKVIALISAKNSSLNVIKGGKIAHVDPLTDAKKSRLADLDKKIFTFEICKLIMKAHEENRLTYEGIAKFRGVKCYSFLMENTFFMPNIYFNTDTYLLEGSEHQSNNKLDTVSHTIYQRTYKDYVEINGVSIPKKITTYKNDKFYDRQVFKKIIFDVTLDDKLFYAPLEKSKYSLK